MPFYEYRCEHCGHELEALQKIGEVLLADCPECTRPTLRKLVSAAGFRLKGSGWYKTDFKGGKKKNLHQGGEPEAGGEKKKDADSSKDAKPEKSGAEKQPAAEPKASRPE